MQTHPFLGRLWWEVALIVAHALGVGILVVKEVDLFMRGKRVFSRQHGGRRDGGVVLQVLP